MDWTKKKVLVTGAGGFIGSHLTERLVALGANTRALIHYNSAGSRGWLDSSPVINDIDVVTGDIRDSDNLQRITKDREIIFHLAALIAIPYSYQTPLAYVRANVEGTLNMLQAAINGGIELFVHTSTSEVYGTAQQVPISEDHPLRGQSPYSASKIGADKIAEAFHLAFSLPVVTLRPFNTYGPRQSARAIIPTIITQALNQDAIHLGNLSPTRDLCFVADTVEGFIKASEHPNAVGNAINIGTGKEISIGDLAALVLKIMGKDIPIVCDDERLRPDTSEVERLCADNRKAAEVSGWQPHYTLEQGLTKTIEWIQKNPHNYRPGDYVL